MVFESESRGRKRDVRVRVSEKGRGEQQEEERGGSSVSRSCESCCCPREVEDKDKEKKKKKKKKFKFKVPASLGWIPANWTWPKIKPVIRCAIVAWVSAVLFVIPAVQRRLGQASFLILIASVFSPPAEAFFTVLEREMLILVFSGLTWAWCCLGLKFADLARTVRDPGATLLDAITGRYLEPAPSGILAVFLGVWTAILLYIRARQGPGPWTLAVVFGCISLDISLTTAALFPFPFYHIGEIIIVPLALHSALALLGSMIIFPTSVSTQFTTRLQEILVPLCTSLSIHQTLLQSNPPFSKEFAETATKLLQSSAQAEVGLLGLAAAVRMMKSELVWARYAPGDYGVFQDLARRMASRANGMGMFFTLIDLERERFPVVGPPSPGPGPGPGPPGTPQRGGERERVEGKEKEKEREGEERSGAEMSSEASEGEQQHQYQRQRSSSLRASHGHHHYAHRHGHGHGYVAQKMLQHAMSVATGRTLAFENAVGVFESQKYLNLEATRFSRGPCGQKEEEECRARAMGLLNESCRDVLEACQKGLGVFKEWLGSGTCDHVGYLTRTGKVKTQWEREMGEHMKVRDDLAAAFKYFREVQRHRVLDPYLPAFESNEDAFDAEQTIPPHRYLFNCYVYQYHLIQFVSNTLELLDEMIRLEKERQTVRLWTPMTRLIRWNSWEVTENVEHEHDEDPNSVQGISPAMVEDLGLPHRRDPDALPPRNVLELFMNLVYHAISGLTRGNVVFAIKAAVLTVALSLPSFLKSSADLSYRNRYVWAVIMAQVTLSRFRGDTVFVFFSRIFSTFMGGVVGLLMWYISCGMGKGNPYGLAAVFAVCSFPFFYALLYLPWVPLTKIVFFVTALLVVGYSYQDVTVNLPGSPGYGLTVAWRRFVLVAIGVSAAFIASFFPPSTTIRRYSRAALATTCSEIGGIYCAILTYANTGRQDEVTEINTSLTAVRSKLRRTMALRANAVYEFSLRGRWPMERYNNLSEIQMQITYGLSHLLSVIKHLESPWARALLRRTRFLETDFQGDTLAVITMISSSIRSGDSLPQITPCPLLHRFILRYHGLNVIHKEAEEDYGLPRTLSLETLRNEQYLFFSVGVATAFSIVTRLDRLMVAAKEIVGEQYHIHGVGLEQTFTLPRENEAEVGKGPSGPPEGV